MILIEKVSQALQKVLTETADRAAKKSQFIKRQVKVSGANFCQTLVFGWLANPQASLEELCQTGAIVGLEISPQGLDQRFTAEAAACLEEVLEETVSQVMSADEVLIPVLQRFEGVYLEDSSTISLPQELAQMWPGCGNSTGQGQAALKLNVRWDALSGRLVGPFLSSGRTHDRKSALQQEPLPVGSLRLADLNYWQLQELQTFDEQGLFWLTRVKPLTAIFTPDGQRWTLPDLMGHQQADELELAVELGVDHRLPARLLARRVPPQVAQQRRRRIRADARRRGRTPSRDQLALADWLIFVTNVPPERLSVAEVFVLARLRWQIELLFKLWKSHNQVDTSRSQNPWRQLCEIYAKLIACIIQHWLLLIGSWAFPDRSFFKAAQTIQKHAWALAAAFSDAPLLYNAIHVIQRCLAAGCRINKRKKIPHTFQLLLALSHSSSLA